jgi:hypothetical protein
MEQNQLPYPTVFHITHWKAGSQWLHRILRDAAADRIVSPVLHEKQFLIDPLISGGIYPTVYVTKQQFKSVQLPENYKKFIIIRDLRDTLVSGYFSIRYSHAVIDKTLADWRQRLESSSLEQGLLILLEEWLPASASIQKSWVESGDAFIRHEDLLENDCEILEDILLNQCRIPITREKLHSIILQNRFENLSGGRKPGQEDLLAHERKGISGDWRNHFTPRVTQAFISQYGDLLVNAGYQLNDFKK